MSNDTDTTHRLRHVVLATSNLEAVSEGLQDYLGVSEGFRHDMSAVLGFRNEMMMIGDMMFELVQPVSPDHRLHRWLAEHGGDGGYMLVFQTFDADAFRARSKQEKLRLTRDMLFRGQDMIQFDPLRFGTHIETYRYDLPNGWWGDPVGREYQKSPKIEAITSCEVAVTAPPGEIAAQMGRLFESEVEGSKVRFRDKSVSFLAAGEEIPGLKALTCKATDPSLKGTSRTIGGLTFHSV